MRIERTVPDLRARIAGWRKEGERIALAPTMGALHEGHMSLVREARKQASRVVVSIFVNPAQFGPQEDFSRYPRTEAADAEMLERAGADLMYAPGVAEMYPSGFRTSVAVSELDRRWEGEIRPGHFSGVATVVTKLLTQAAPDVALFGEKDFQQLQIVRRLVRDLDLPVTVAGCPIVRDAEGLALSSRNAYLGARELEVARQLNRVMSGIVQRLNAPGSDVTANLTGEGRKSLLESGFDSVDYLVVCDPETLEPLGLVGNREARLLAAGRIGTVRLLDNMAVPSRE